MCARDIVITVAAVLGGLWMAFTAGYVAGRRDRGRQCGPGQQCQK